MPHPRAKVHTQMPLPWNVLDRQMPRGGWACLDLTHALLITMRLSGKRGHGHADVENADMENADMENFMFLSNIRQKLKLIHTVTI